jgi:hypothetical protein
MLDVLLSVVRVVTGLKMRVNAVLIRDCIAGRYESGRDMEGELKAGGIEHLRPHGSRARGTEEPDSPDVDVAADFDRGEEVFADRARASGESADRYSRR